MKESTLNIISVPNKERSIKNKDQNLVQKKKRYRRHSDQYKLQSQEDTCKYCQTIEWCTQLQHESKMLGTNEVPKLDLEVKNKKNQHRSTQTWQSSITQLGGLSKNNQRWRSGSWRRVMAEVCKSYTRNQKSRNPRSFMLQTSRIMNKNWKLARESRSANKTRSWV